MLEMKDGWIPVTKTEFKPITVKRKMHGIGTIDMHISYLDWLESYKSMLEKKGIRCKIETIESENTQYYRLVAWYNDYLWADGELLRFKNAVK